MSAKKKVVRITRAFSPPKDWVIVEVRPSAEAVSVMEKLEVEEKPRMRKRGEKK